MTAKWVCAQIGAREHYAIPRALHRRALLARLYTDVWAGPTLSRLKFGPLRALATRCHPEVPAGLVTGFTGSAIVQRMRDGLFPARDLDAEIARHLRIGAAFGRRVAEALSRLPETPATFFAYNTGALEPVERINQIGCQTLVDQIDPARVEEEIVQQECEKWPGWMTRPGRIPDEYFARLESEWRAASRVVVNSEWSRAALIAQGVPEHKLVVLPLAYEPPNDLAAHKRADTAPLTVLWLGQVVLRKGIQYLLEAARRLRSRNVRFLVAGPTGISSQALASAPPGVTFLGPVTRDRASQLYRTADVFVLPTLSDGFAITQLEAMAHGLPVVTTPNCGRVVTDCADGRIVPAGDADALASALDALASDRELREAMGKQAELTARNYSVDRLADRLEELTRAGRNPERPRA